LGPGSLFSGCLNMERVVITGLGVISPLGNSPSELFDNLLEGNSGIDVIQSFDPSDLPTRIAGEVKGLDLDSFFSVKERKRLDRYSQFAIMAADQAIKQSGILESDADPTRMGVFVGSGIGGIQTLEATHSSFLSRGPKGVSPFFISNLISNMAGGNIAIRHGFKGTNFCMTSACATGTHCIGEAFREIAMGYQDAMIAGGAESSVTPLTIAGFSNMKAMSRQNASPQTASSPYDLNRDGFVMGEGAGVLLLESLNHAQKRGAQILGELAGYGATCDAHHITAVAPGGEGVVRAAQIALKQSGISPDEVDYVNSHGTSTPIGDKFETEFLKTVFAEHSRSLWISSTKSMIGHLLGAAGGVESVVCVMSLQKGQVHPTRNLQEPDPDCDLDYIPEGPREKSLKVVLKNSMGFGGHNAVLLFRVFN
jgi:3-oxoacyl-[acyl-carrier-protein] synthase II